MPKYCQRHNGWMEVAFLHQSCYLWITKGSRITRNLFLITYITSTFLYCLFTLLTTPPLEITQITCRRTTGRRSPHCKPYHLRHVFECNLDRYVYVWCLNRHFSTHVTLVHCLVRSTSPKTHPVNVTHEDHLYLDRIDLDHYTCLNKRRSICHRNSKGARSPRGSGSRVSE